MKSDLRSNQKIFGCRKSSAVPPVSSPRVPVSPSLHRSSIPLFHLPAPPIFRLQVSVYSLPTFHHSIIPSLNPVPQFQFPSHPPFQLHRKSLQINKPLRGDASRYPTAYYRTHPLSCANILDLSPSKQLSLSFNKEFSIGQDCIELHQNSSKCG